jgi:hypothetical protein
MAAITACQFIQTYFGYPELPASSPSVTKVAAASPAATPTSAPIWTIISACTHVHCVHERKTVKSLEKLTDVSHIQNVTLAKSSTPVATQLSKLM